MLRCMPEVGADAPALTTTAQAIASLSPASATTSAYPNRYYEQVKLRRSVCVCVEGTCPPVESSSQQKILAGSARQSTAAYLSRVTAMMCPNDGSATFAEAYTTRSSGTESGSVGLECYSAVPRCTCVRFAGATDTAKRTE